MIQHHAPISGVAAFRDRYVATAGYDNQVILWDARRRAPLARSCHDHLANQCAFSPDGRLLGTASSDYTARLWRLPDMQLTAVLGDHRDDVEMVAFHPERALVASASRDHAVRVFDTEGRLLHRLEGHEADVISVEWLAGGDELISSSDDGTIRRWSLARGAQVGMVDMNGVETDTVVATPDGIIYSGNDEGEIVTVREGAPPTRVRAHAAGIKRLVYNPRSGLLVSMSYDRTLKLWASDPDGALVQRASSALPPVVWPRACAFEGDAELVFGTFGSSYASYDIVTGIWDLRRVEPTWGLNAVARHEGATYAVGDAGIVIKDGQPARELGSLCNFLVPIEGALLTGGQMGVVFDAMTGRRVHEHRSPLNCGAALDAGRRRAILGTYTGEGLILAVDEAGTVRHERTIALHDNAIKGLACSPDGLVFSVCATGAAAFHDAASGALIRRIERAHDRIANGCAAIAGGVFASISRDRRLRIWASPDEVMAHPTPHTHSIKCVAVSATGRWVATGSYDGTVAVFDLRQETWIRTERPTAHGISSLCADGDAFLGSSYDGTIYRITAAEGAGRA